MCLFLPLLRCGHCKSLAPHWATAATELKGKVKLGALDATTHTAMAGRYQVSATPWILKLSMIRQIWYNTVEPPNKGHLGTRATVLYSEVSFIRMLEMY